MHDGGDDTLYAQVAADIASLILRGAMRPGDRLPSVRRTSRERGVSVSTAVAAYVKLESEGLIEARPKSGHFVRGGDDVVQVPRAERPRFAASRVSVSTGVTALIASMRDATVIPLGSAAVAPELLPIRALNRTLASIARETGTAGADYDAPPGLSTLRKQLAKRSMAWGLSLHEDEFVTTIGATEAMHLCLRAVTRAGDAVAVATPCYFGILQLIEEMGLRAVEIPGDPATGMDLDALDTAVRKAPISACLVISNFDNPLGALMPEASKERLVRLLARHDIPLIEDDIYGDLAFDGSRPRPAKAHDRDGRVLLCGSVSKTLAAGYRVGWVAGGRYQPLVERLKFSQSIATSTLPQMAVAEYLAGGRYDRHLRSLRARFATQVQRCREAIALSFPRGTRISEPRGGFFLWVEMPAEIDALRLQAEALQRGIAIAPGPIFSARHRFESCIRISCGFPWSPQIAAAIGTLGELAYAELARARVSRRRRSA